MPAATQPLSLAGQTMRWKFDAGPTAGAIYEHTFNSDGTVLYKQLDDSGAATAAKPEPGSAEKRPAEKKEPTRYVSFEVGEGMHLMSYRSSAGWTLTIHVNGPDEKLHGFASNDKEWYPVTGVIVS
jgi:hypothetical protein